MKRAKEFDFMFDEKIDKMGKQSFSYLKKQIFAIKNAREQMTTVFFADSLKTGLFEVDCKSVRDKLEKQVRNVISNLITSLLSKISSENNKLGQEIVEIEEKLGTEVNNIEELEVARDYAQNIDVILKDVMVKIREIMGKMDLVEDLQYQIPYEDFISAWKSFEFPARVKARARRAIQRLERREKDLVQQLKRDQEKLDKDIAELTIEFDKATQFDNLEDSDSASKLFIDLYTRINDSMERAKQIQNAERITNQSKVSEYINLHELVKQFNPYYKFWEYASNLKYKYLRKIELPLEEIVKTEFTVEINEVWNDLFRMEKTDFKLVPHMLVISKKLRAKYTEIKPLIPLVADLKNEALKVRHWKDIMQTLKIECEVNEVQKVTLRKFLDHGAMENRDQIKDISEIAAKENSFVKLLNTLKIEWRGIPFEVKEFRNTGKYILKNVDPITDKLDEDIAKLSSILSSPYVKFLENDIVTERNTLTQNQECIEVWIKVQKHWQYLQPIFSSEDIIKQRPAEAAKFQSIETTFVSAMENARTSANVPEACKQQKLFENLVYCFNTAEDIIKSLNDYLNSKRQAFPRFYFLPNEELLTILAQTKEVRMIQKFLSKCFEGIETLTFTDDNLITEMRSIHLEKIAFLQEIDPFDEPNVPRNVEEWLTEVETGMKLALKDNFRGALEDFSTDQKERWLFAWPSQIVIAVGQALWTAEVEDALNQMPTDPDALQAAHKLQENKLMQIVHMIQKGDYEQRDTITLEVLIILELHGLDVIEDLRKNKIQGKDFFEWTSQLRYYWQYYEKEKTFKLVSKMIITERAYGWEYLGNQGRLVITPLTDRCYRTLMSALHMNLGGAPEGPAGTGKTETTKDLARALAKHCVVFNCSDDLEITQMSKFFMGLTSCGSWACFDEFNRIVVDVLSVIAQQILQIQTAILIDSESRAPSRQFIFCGTLVKLDPSCAIFITMNPGYAGRSELPDNLKRLFRSIAMMIPNYSMIAEISLFSYGYQSARNLATKIVQSLKLSSEQLSTQSHYDFGMRSLKTILIAAGNLKREYPAEKENALIIRAICDCTFPKFTSEDIPLFDNILNDLFPNEQRMNFDYENIDFGIHKAAKKHNLVLEQNFKDKIIQLYETIRVRHGLMIVGEPFSGKTSIMNTLQVGWKLADRVKGLRRRLKLEAKKRVLESREKKNLTKRASISKLIAISLLTRKNTESLEKELPTEKVNQEDPEFVAAYTKVYKELVENIDVEELIKERNGLGIHIDRINPKSIPNPLLFGVVDETSGDWKEGVTAKVFKECTADETGNLRWITFDGPVDAVWIENMNTVLDDNKKLCLANSEVIKMTSKMSIIFEVEDLAEASLATVSRCGMVFMEARQLNKRSIFENWYHELPDLFHSKEQYAFLDLLFNEVIELGFKLFKDENVKPVSHISEHHMLNNILRYFQGQIFKGKSRADIYNDLQIEIEKQKALEEEARMLGNEISSEPIKKHHEFGKAEKSEWMASMIFSVIWGVGSYCDQLSRSYFGSMFGSELKTVYLTALKGMQDSAYPPDSLKESLFDVFYSFDSKSWQPFNSLMGNLKIAQDTKFSEIFIPTKDSLRNTYLMKVMVKQEFPFLFFGKTGTAKTQIVKKLVMEELDQNRYIPLITVLSANTKREQLQDVLESKLEKQKRAKGIYGPLMGSKNIIFIDDLNMPNKEQYGAQPPLELIRQAIDDKGWYDRKSLEFKTIVDIQFIAAMGLGRPNIPNRLNRHFTTVNLFEYDEETIKYVYKCIIDHGFGQMPEKVKSFSQKIVNICVKMYRFVCKDFKPLPGKSHYLFNLRDLSKITQGILSVSDQELVDVNVNLTSKMAKLISYEAKRVFSDRFVEQKDKDDFFNSNVRPIISEFLQEPYEKLVPSDNFYVFGNFVDQNSITKQYKEISSLQVFKNAVNQFIDEFNEINKKKISILLFEECLDNLAKVNRILSREYGHALQVGLGGDGRRTLTRLATFMQSYELTEPDIQKDLNYMDWQDFLREVFRNSGIKNKRCTILVTDNQLSKDTFFEDINNLLNIGEVPNLFKLDDKEAIISDLKQVYAKAGKRNLSNLQAWEAFLTNCKSNLHLVLCVSPIGDSLRLRLRNFPSLVNCSSIIWYLPWTNDSLKMIGSDILQNNEEVKEMITGKEAELVDIFVELHQIISSETSRFQKEMKKYYYVTPLNYRILLQNFNGLLTKKKSELLHEKNRYETGIKKLDECAEFVEVTKKKLEEFAPQLQLKSKQAEEAFSKVEKETAIIEAKEKIISKDKEAAEEKKRIAEQIKATCDEKLSEALPALQAAQEKVSKLDKGFLYEIRSMKEPPEKAIIILEGVLRLFGFIPKKSQDSRKFYIETLKKQLNVVETFFNQLRQFNVETVSESTINNVKSYISANTKFNYNIAKDASQSMVILYEWVIALITYYDSYRTILPLREDLAKAQESLVQADADLAQKQSELQIVQDKVDLLKRELESIQNEQNRLAREIRESEIKLNRSLELNDKLSGERIRWESQVETLGREIDNVLGDMVLACGYLSYMGPFTLDFRKRILSQRWIPAVDQREIPNSGDKFTLANVIGNPIHIQEWNFCGLPFDATSIENVIIMKSYQDKFPLVIDPQNQFLKFIKEYEKKKSPTGFHVIKASLEARDLERHVTNSVRRGDVLIIEAISENISYIFDDLLSGNFTYSAGMKNVQVGTQVIEVDSGFRMYLVSNLTSPHYSPELLSKVVYLDFSITPTGLQQQMISLVCKTEEPKDEEEKNLITRESIEYMQKQKDTELKILKLLSDSKGNVVENDALINSLNESKATSEDIKSRLKQSAKTEEKIEKNRQNYKPLANLISNIFQILKDMYKLDPMYQFSLRWFEKMIVKTITSTEKPPIKNVEKRVADLRESVLKACYVQICKSIFVKDKQLYSFLLAVILLKTEEKLNPDTWMVMLTEKGITRLTEDEQQEELLQPQNISNATWRKIDEISKLAEFENVKRFAAHKSDEFLSFVEQMDSKDYFEAESWGNSLLAPFSQFSALTFIKIFRPDLFPKYSREFVRLTLSQFFTEEAIVPLEKSFEESSPTIPFIYILSPGDDPQEEIKKFAAEKGMRVQPISLGRGQGEEAERTIMECALSGGGSWVLLQNCHLAVQWLQNLERILEEIGSEKHAKALDRSFRLFLTAASTPEFPISILQTGIKLTKDPPKGVKANMLQIYLTQASTKLEKKFYADINELRAEDWKPLYMALSFFHSVIRERRRFGPVGWNIPYDFNESDFKISVRQLKYVLNSNPASIPFKALIYLTSECYYGGKVTDSMDRRLLITLLSDFYNHSAIKEKYHFSESQEYFIPLESLGLDEAVSFIASLPDRNDPQIYGLNPNASISSAINDTALMVDSILAINPSSSGSLSAADLNSQLKASVHGLLRLVPDPFDLAGVRAKHPIAYGQCMNTVLIQEVLRYNALLAAIKSSCRDLLDATEGSIVMTSLLEEMADRVLKNQVPSQWSKKSYPSLKPMMSYIEDLGLRIKMFRDWVDHGQPKVYWVPGFYFTQSFFTGVLQDYARKHAISIDGLEFKHFVMKPDFEPAAEVQEGCYTNGLYLEAACWDAHRDCLEESVPKKVFFDMPTVASAHQIYFKPFEVKKEEAAAEASAHVYE